MASTPLDFGGSATRGGVAVAVSVGGDVALASLGTDVTVGTETRERKWEAMRSDIAAQAITTATIAAVATTGAMASTDPPVRTRGWVLVATVTGARRAVTSESAVCAAQMEFTITLMSA